MTEEVVFQVQQGRPFVSLETLADGNVEVRTAVAFVHRASPIQETRAVQAYFPVADRLAEMLERSPSATSRLVDGLVRRGYVVRAEGAPAWSRLDEPGDPGDGAAAYGHGAVSGRRLIPPQRAAGR